MTPAHRPVRRRLRTAFLVAAVLVGGAVPAACGAASAGTRAGSISVVTDLWPLAQEADLVGGGSVHVTDLSPPGHDPAGLRLDAAARSTLAHASVVLEVGGGFAPGFESAAAGHAHVLSLRSLSPDPDPWLEPKVLERSGDQLAAALTAVDPAGAAAWSNGARDQTEELGSLDIDLHESLSDCPRHTVITPDDAFAGLAHSYSLTDHTLGTAARPSAAAVASGVAAVRASGSRDVFTEPWVSDTEALRVAAAAGRGTHVLDTLEEAPPAGWPRGATYVALLEEDLGRITAALSCSAMGGTN